MMSGASRLRLPSKTFKMSAATLLKSFQSFFGAPRSSQIIGIGYGSQTAETKSAEPVFAIGSTSEFSTSRMMGRKRSATRGLNAGATSRRSRTCSGPSADRIEFCRGRLLYSSLSVGCDSEINPTALNQRLSRSTATTSSYFKIE